VQVRVGFALRVSTNGQFGAHCDLGRVALAGDRDIAVVRLTDQVRGARGWDRILDGLRGDIPRVGAGGEQRDQEEGGSHGGAATFLTPVIRMQQGGIAMGQ
jgi:hypothetical protein